MIPLKDCNPTRRFAVITFSIIVLNVAVFIKDRLTGHYERSLMHTDQGVVAVSHFVGGLSERLSLVPAEAGQPSLYRMADHLHLNVPARQLAAHRLEHALSLDFRQYHRSYPGTGPLSPLLFHLWHCCSIRAGVERPHFHSSQ